MLKSLTGVLLSLAAWAGVLCAQNPAAPTPFFCAQEGGTCRFTGMGMAYFGTGNVFAVRTMTDGAACTAAVFGDPVPNVAKYCLTSAMPGQETECAPEGRSCAVSAPALMLYGANGVYSGKVVTQTTACSNAVFGDPAPNAAKACLLVNMPTPPPAPPAVRAAAPIARPVVTYATLRLVGSVAGYVAANAAGQLRLDGREYAAVFFVVSGVHSPPAFGDLVRLSDLGGGSVLVGQADETMAMQPGATSSGLQFRVKNPKGNAGSLADGSFFVLEAQPGARPVRFDSGVFSAPLHPASYDYALFEIHLHTLAQINQLQAQRKASENTSAKPQLRH